MNYKLFREILIFLIISISCTFSKAQYINEAGEAMVDDIVNLLKSFEPLSQAQDSMAKAVIQSMLAATKSNPLLQADIEKKKNVFLTMVDIATQKGKFEFLTNRYKEYREKELRLLQLVL